MSATETIHLLICSESQQDTEYYNNLIRSAGLGSRLHRATSLEDLNDSLKDTQWELVLSTDAHPEISPVTAIEAASKLATRIPVVVSISNPDADREALYNAGADDVISRDQGLQLVRAVRRAADASRCRRQLAEMTVAYEEAARRCELLLKSAQDAIAYITDGMHIHANELYAKLFAYDDVDELAGIPLVDLIAPANQQDFKDALRRYRDNPQEQTQISFTGIRADQSEFPATLILSSATYEGEPCMQALVRAETAAPALQAPQVAATETHSGGSAADLRNLVDATIGSPSGHLALIVVDSFDNHVKGLGFSKANELINSLGQWLTEAANWRIPPQRISTDVYAGVLVDEDSGACAKAAAEMARALGSQIHDLGDESVQASCCIALAGVNDESAELGSDAIIDAAWTALREAHQAQHAPGAASAERVRTISFTVEPPQPEISEESYQTIEQALTDNQIKLMFQPVVSLRGDSSEHYEVSLWHGSGDAAKSIKSWLNDQGVAEIGTVLDRWEVEHAFKALAAHQGDYPQTKLIINLDKASLADPDFVAWLGQALNAEQLQPASLIFQLPIDIVNTQLKNAKEFSDRVSAIGCQLSISEIDCSPGILGSIEHLSPSFAKLKGDISGMLDKPEQVEQQLKPLIEGLHRAQMASIMPEVKSAGSLAVLWQLGIHFIQGDYLQRPALSMNYEFTDLA